MTLEHQLLLAPAPSEVMMGSSALLNRALENEIIHLGLSISAFANRRWPGIISSLSFCTHHQWVLIQNFLLISLPLVPNGRSCHLPIS